MENIEFYEFAKILHIISMTAWFAGLFYLPRLFVYHVKNIENNDICNNFKIMEFKLFNYIMTPAMIATVLFGVMMTYVIGLKFGWLHFKISLVFLLILYHFFLGKCLKNFAQNKNRFNEKFFRLINEVPTIFLIAIVSLVVLKPF